MSFASKVRQFPHRRIPECAWARPSPPRPQGQGSSPGNRVAVSDTARWAPPEMIERPRASAAPPEMLERLPASATPGSGML